MIDRSIVWLESLAELVRALQTLNDFRALEPLPVELEVGCQFLNGRRKIRVPR